MINQGRPGGRPWLIVVSCFIGVSVSIAPAYMTVFGLFIKPMTEALGLSRTQLSLGLSLMALLAALCSPFVGRLIDRWGARRIAAVGTVLLPFGLLGHAFLEPDVTLFLALSLVMGLAAAVACPLPYVSALPQWFERNLGLSIALSMTGIGLGQVVLPKLCAYLITTGGWRQAWAIMAAIVFVVGVANVALLFRDNPEFRARRANELRDRDEPALSGFSLREALRMPAFWLLAASVCLVAQVGVGAMIHIVPLLTDRGVPSATATNAVVILGMGSLIGRLATGAALDRFGIAPVGALLFALQGCGMLALWSGAGGLVPNMAVFFVGLAIGAETDIIPFAVRRTFGMRQFGSIFGAVYGLFSLGPVIGPLLMGTAYDRLGSYDLVLLCFAASAFLAAVFIAAAGRASVRFDDAPPGFGDAGPSAPKALRLQR